MPAKIVARFAGMIVYEETEAVVYCVGEGEVCRLRKAGTAVEQPDPARWVEGHFEGLKAALNDPLAEQVLAAGEPSFAAVAGLLPPLRDLAFLGDEGALERLEVTPEGAVCVTQSVAGSRPTGVMMRDDLPAPPEGELVSAGLLDGWLPALVHEYVHDAETRELLQFAGPGHDGKLDLWRRVKAGTGFGATFAYARNAEPVEAAEFYARLLELWRHWRGFVKEGMGTDLPEAELQAAAQGMLVLGTLTFRGLVSRYGVGWYDEPNAHSFPPAIIFLVQALLAWGHEDRARELLGHYLARYVQDDGTLNYYGPAVAEYGQLLALAADVTRVTKDEQWLLQRLTTLRPVWQRLVGLRAQSLARYREGDRHRGLIPGLPEADYHAQEAEWHSFYYAGDVWATRGLQEMGETLQGLDGPGLHGEGAALVAEAEAYRQDVLASLQIAMSENAEYVPPGPDQTEPIDRLTADRHASYCNYRYLPEMLSAGVLPAELVTKVAQWRRAHGGELLAGTRFEQQMDDWPALHYARGLLETDDIDHYLLLMYGHWAHHCAQGTLSSYEQVRVEPDGSGTRRMVAGQVVPCQVMVPTMLRWALVYEERDAEVLWLGKAMPRRWLAPGQKVKVSDVPTRFGEVGFTIRRTDATEAEVTLRLPKKGLAAEVRLRLRAEEGAPVQARLGEEALVVEGDVVSLPAGLKGKLKVVVCWDER